MTFGEFKAWLEGFSEAFVQGSPNKKQWNRIKERLEEVKLKNSPIIIKEKEYIRPWWPTWYYNYEITGTSLSSGCGSRVSYGNEGITTVTNDNANTYYCNTAKEIGRLEAGRL